jgi:hypothetical protein
MLVTVTSSTYKIFKKKKGLFYFVKYFNYVSMGNDTDFSCLKFLYTLKFLRGRE